MIYSYGYSDSSTNDLDHDHDDGATEYNAGTGKWGPSGTLGTSGGTVTWSLAGAGLSNATGGDFFTGSTVSFGSITNFDYTAVINQVFDAWSAVANIDFQQVADGGGNIGVGTTANIRIAAGYIDGAPANGSVLARAYLPTNGGTASQSATSGDVVMDRSETWTSHLFFLTMLHEVGHSLGLHHSNFSTAIMYPSINTSLTGLSADDIAGIRSLYGARTATDDVGGTVQTASTIGSNETKTGEIEVGADQDWYALNVTSGATYSIELRGAGSLMGTLTDTVLAVYSASGSTLAYNDDEPVGGYESALEYTATFTGTVYVSAQSYSTNTGTYTLSVASQDGVTTGNDDLVGTSGDDRIYLDSGNDIYSGLGGDDNIYGEEGNDRLYGGNGSDYISGGTGNDTIVGGSGNDTIHGGGDVDLINGNSGNDAIFGQDGNDTIDGGTGRDMVSGGDGDDELSGGLERDSIYGGAGNDIIYGGGHSDRINGNSGNDVIFGQAGNDTIDGGTDRDRIYGGEGNDTIYGGGHADFVNGNGGNDVLFGEGGNDTLDGGTGRDRVFGGNGNDTLSGGLEHDSIYGGDGDDNIRGGGHSDLLVGNGGRDVIYGDGGNDDIRGGAGRDVIVGGNGNDSLSGGLDNDVVVGGDGNDVILGGGGSDLLRGQDGDDTISGANGGDQIFGGLGNDMLYGGANDGRQDTFSFSNLNGLDRVYDFEDGIDLIGFSSHSIISQYSDVLSRASSSGNAGQNTLITIDAANSITLVGVALSDLSADDFTF